MLASVACEDGTTTSYKESDGAPEGYARTYEQDARAAASGTLTRRPARETNRITSTGIWLAVHTPAPANPLGARVPPVHGMWSYTTTYRLAIGTSNLVSPWTISPDGEVAT